jgi:hypothetical protein
VFRLCSCICRSSICDCLSLDLGNVVGGIKREHEDDSFQAPMKKRTRVIKHEIVDVDMFESGKALNVFTNFI